VFLGRLAGGRLSRVPVSPAAAAYGGAASGYYGYDAGYHRYFGNPAPGLINWSGSYGAAGEQNGYRKFK